MNRISIIIQSEGKGHFSQALEAIRILRSNGREITAVFIGKRPVRKLPDYFTSELAESPHTFLSPGFLMKSNQRGISLLRTLLFNVPLAPLFYAAALGLRRDIRRTGADTVLNFYDPVGAVACRRLRKKRRIISVSHHFYLSHPSFFSPRGFGIQPFLLGFMNAYFMRHSDRVLALSFRREKPFRKIRVIPPLIDDRIRQAERGQPGNDLCYLLNAGFIDALTTHYAVNETVSLDLFTEGSTLVSDSGKVAIHAPERDRFIQHLLHCRRLICTAGFDAVAEAFYLGVPVFLIPSEDHFEQYCNALDASRTSLAFHLERITDLSDVVFEPANNAPFRSWSARVDAIFLKETSG
jgi:uncharacterized protein (TIGR00661 family)